MCEARKALDSKHTVAVVPYCCMLRGKKQILIVLNVCISVLKAKQYYWDTIQAYNSVNTEFSCRSNCVGLPVCFMWWSWFVFFFFVCVQSWKHCSLFFFKEWLTLSYHLRYKMQKSILTETGSNKIYLYAKRELLKWIETIYAREKICMPCPSTWLLQDHPFESFQEECEMNSLLTLTKVSFKNFFVNMHSSADPAFFIIICTCPPCFSLMCKSDCIVCLFLFCQHRKACLLIPYLL